MSTWSRRQWIWTAGAVSTLFPRARAASVSLWNGRDLSGWRHAAHGIWTIEDGALVGRANHDQPGPGYLLTETEYQDFRLNLEFWISRGGNSGVYIREPKQEWGPKGDARPAHGETRGYEIQIDYNDKKNLTGSVYALQSSTKLVGGEDRWNRMEIECRGPRALVRINGELVNDYAELWLQKGVVGMQIHGGRPHHHVVRYRKIEISSFD